MKLTNTLFPIALTLLGTAGCLASSHDLAAPSLGQTSSAQAMEAHLDEAGEVTLEVVKGADWAVPRSGLLNLDHEKAKAAGLQDRDEPIGVYTYVIRHPKFGAYLIDAGVAAKLVQDPAGAGIGPIVRHFLDPNKMKVGESTDHVVARLGQPLAGVFLTHLHIDHMTGLPAIPRGTPLFLGPGEARHRAWGNALMKGSIDGLLEGHAALQEWRFAPDPSGRFAGVVDVFGDGSVFALLVPGHTPGSTAFVVRTPNGPVLLTSDVCHTRWGWDNDVEPGSFTDDHAANAASLKALRDLASRHPRMLVRLGHQE